MNIRRQLFGIALLALGLFLGLSPTSLALAQDNTSPKHSQSSNQEPQNANQLTASDEAQTRSIALARCHFLERIPRFGPFPIDQTSDTYCVALFPAGRSDRIYILMTGWWLNHNETEEGNLILCYQRKNGRDKLVYRISLHAPVHPPAVHEARSLLDILSGGGYAPGGISQMDSTFSLEGRMTRFEKADLATERDYTAYTWVPYNDTLEVWVPYDHKSGKLNSHDLAATYFLGEDLFTKALLKEGVYEVNDGTRVCDITNGKQEFYKKYGLPVAKGELGFIAGAIR